MACIWFICMTGSLLAAWNSSLKPFSLAISSDLHLHGREVRGLQLLLGEPDDDVLEVGLHAAGGPLSGLLGRVDLATGRHRQHGGRGGGGTDQPAASRLVLICFSLTTRNRLLGGRLGRAGLLAGE